MANNLLVSIWKRNANSIDKSIRERALAHLKEHNLLNSLVKPIEEALEQDKLLLDRAIEPVKVILTFKISQSLKEQFDLYLKSQNYNLFIDKSKVLRQILYEFLNKQSPDKINSVYQ